MSESKHQNPREKPCDVCGNSEFLWGTVLNAGHQNPEGTKLFFRPFASSFEDGDYVIMTRYCEVCGNVKFFADL